MAKETLFQELLPFTLNNPIPELRGLGNGLLAFPDDEIGHLNSQHWENQHGDDGRDE